jgi:hypothetical protein
MQTLADYLAWLWRHQQAGVTALPVPEVAEAFTLLQRHYEGLVAQQAQAIATLDALLEEERDERYRVAFDNGFHRGWARALAAVAEG